MFPSRAADLSRLQRRKERRAKGTTASTLAGQAVPYAEPDTEAAAMERLFVDESQLFTFMHQVNEIYLDLLKQPPPFARYILLGLQSTGKSTQVERLLKFPMNIVAEGTGTRCPLYVTCIHEKTITEAECRLSGCSKCANADERISLKDVFSKVTTHNKEHVNGFSNDPLRLSVKSKDVHNMFFVDLPGIITTKGTGDDNRKAIKDILKKEIKVPNTKLLVLLEPKEFATNSIIDFVDETLGKREAWVPKTLFLMTKFDLRTSDSLTGGKTNRFLDEYWANGISPFMVITPTLQKATETMSAEEQYQARQQLLDSAGQFEQGKFSDWRDAMARAFAEDARSEEFAAKFEPYIGFAAAVAEMNRLLLEDTRGRLPQVLQDLSKKRETAVAELSSLEEASHFLDPAQIQLRMADVMHQVVVRITSYLDGSLHIADKLPQMHQELMDEIEGEEDSDWAARELNHLTEAEEVWREHIAGMAERGAWPKNVQASGVFLGGKQYQRALSFFKAVMIDRLPDPHHLRPFVVTATGTLHGGLSHEDWEHATVEIIRTCVRNVAEAGVNYFVKHVLYIFRRLVHVAFEDARSGEMCSAMFKSMPSTLHRWLVRQYDEMLWELGCDAVKKCQVSMEPFYSTVNPALPTLTARQTESPQLKAGWSQFMNVLRENKVEHFYHFTDERNWESIQKMGGLYSWQWMEQHGHKIPAPGGSQVSRDLDMKNSVADYVHLSFCMYHPMLAATQHDGRTGKVVLLAVDPVVATWKGTLFSDMNATQNGVNIGSELADLQKVQFAEATTQKGEAAKLTEPQKSHHQAEVMVKTHVPIDYITLVAEVPREAGIVAKMVEAAQSTISAVKASLQVQAENSAYRRVEFLPTARSAMICDDEVDLILDRSYEYIVGLFQFILTTMEFQLNHYLFIEFKNRLAKRLGFQLVASTDWKSLCKPDASIAKRIDELKTQVEAVTEALATVRNIQSSAPSVS